MRISLRFLLVFIFLSVVTTKLRAKKWLSSPAVMISEEMNDAWLDELLFYAEVLGIGDSATIQVRYSLRLPDSKNGLIQYRNSGFGKERHQVMIWINRRISLSAQSMTLAHEMVHAAQYIHGALTLDENVAHWHDQTFVVDHIPYEDRPWEKEAHEWAYELRTDYLEFTKRRERYQSGIHPFPESL